MLHDVHVILSTPCIRVSMSGSGQLIFAGVSAGRRTFSILIRVVFYGPSFFSCFVLVDVQTRRYLLETFTVYDKTILS